MDETELPARLAGRVIPIDPSGRVLLFRYDDPPPKGPHWATPGGGIEAGEDYYAAARRELTEETGWTDVPVAPGEVHQESTVQWAGGCADGATTITSRAGGGRRHHSTVPHAHQRQNPRSTLVDTHRDGHNRASCVYTGASRDKKKNKNTNKTQHNNPVRRMVRQHDHYFVARVAVAERPLGEVAAMHVSDGIHEARWWTLAELDATGQAVYPRGLAELLRRLGHSGLAAGPGQESGTPASS